MDLAEVCASLRQNSSTLTVVDLSNDLVGNEGIKKLCSHMECSSKPSLVMLWLDNNQISFKGCDALARLLTLNGSLKYLYISRNSLGDDGIGVLTKSRCFEHVHVINLADNFIGCAGAKRIAESLRVRQSDSTKAVKTLVLESNNIGDEGASALADCLKTNNTLETLNLRFNGLSVAALEAVHSVLSKHNQTLKYLHLEESGNGVDCCHTTPASSLRSVGPSSSRRQDYSARLTSTARSDQDQAEKSNLVCSCSTCQLRRGIDFYLALNRAGRRSIGDISISIPLFPRILSKGSDDPSVQFTLMLQRPDLFGNQRSTASSRTMTEMK